MVQDFVKNPSADSDRLNGAVREVTFQIARCRATDGSINQEISTVTSRQKQRVCLAALPLCMKLFTLSNSQTYLLWRRVKYYGNRFNSKRRVDLSTLSKIYL